MRSKLHTTTNTGANTQGTVLGLGVDLEAYKLGIADPSL